MKRSIKVLGAVAVGTLIPLVAPAAAFADPSVPNPKPKAPPGVSEKVDKLLGFMMWGGGVVVLAGILIAAYVMSIGGRHGQGGREGMDKLTWVAVAAVLIGSASTLAGWLLS